MRANASTLGDRYIEIKVDETGKRLCVYVEDFTQMARDWAVSNGIVSEESTVNNALGVQATRTNWGCGTDYQVRRCVLETRAALRAEWPQSAKNLCERYEFKICDLFDTRKRLERELEAKDAEVQRTTIALAKAERERLAAEAIADEMRKRAAAVDAAKLRREIEFEAEQKSARVIEENKRLAAQLHDISSQAAKLSEDKRRLRSALNSARNGR